MKPTESKISFTTEFQIGQTIIALNRDGNEIRQVTIKEIHVEFNKEGTVMEILGERFKYSELSWHFYQFADMGFAKEKMLEIKFANIPNKG